MKRADIMAFLQRVEIRIMMMNRREAVKALLVVVAVMLGIGFIIGMLLFVAE